MDYDFALVFCNKETKQDEFKLHYILKDTGISFKWFIELNKAVKENTPINNTRFYNFVNDPWTQQKIADEINLRIDICNNEYPNLIPYKVDENLTQEDHNNLHLFFEKYRGAILDPHPYYINGSKDYKKSMAELNILIHRWEGLNSDGLGINRRCIFEFEKKERKLLIDADYQYFKLSNNFAEIYLNYCEVGKQLWDVCRDEDEVVGEDNIRPLRYYSVEFGIKFSQTTLEEEKANLKKFYDWFARNENFLNNLGFYKNDPKISLGYIPVATWIDDYSHDYVIQNIEKRQFLKRIEMG